MKNTFFVFFLTILLCTAITSPASAQEKSTADKPQHINTQNEWVRDNRAEILRQFLQQYDSPLATHAQTFVDEADKNNIDWKLVPAISGVESTFGHAEPYQCYNSWGYNIYGNTTRCFADYDEAISIISRDLRHLYMDSWGAQDVYQIGSKYAASPTWAYRVSGYMDDIDTFASKFTSKTLPLSL